MTSSFPDEIQWGYVGEASKQREKKVHAAVSAAAAAQKRRRGYPREVSWRKGRVGSARHLHIAASGEELKIFVVWFMIVLSFFLLANLAGAVKWVGTRPYRFTGFPLRLRNGD